MNTVAEPLQVREEKPAWRESSRALAAEGPFAEERAIVEACQNGDRDSQRKLYDQHCRKVYRLMYRMVGARYADDLTQQVFLRVLQTIRQFSGRSTFSTWLYRLAVNEALQFLRRNRRRTTQAYPTEPTDTRPSALTRLEDRDLLEYALARLDPDLRSAFLLREWEGLSYHELSRALGVSEGTVGSRLNRARRVLGEFIAEHG